MICWQKLLATSVTGVSSSLPLLLTSNWHMDRWSCQSLPEIILHGSGFPQGWMFKLKFSRCLNYTLNHVEDNQSSQQQGEGCGVVKVGKCSEQKEQCHLTDLQGQSRCESVYSVAVNMYFVCRLESTYIQMCIHMCIKTGGEKIQGKTNTTHLSDWEVETEADKQGDWNIDRGTLIIVESSTSKCCLLERPCGKLLSMQVLTQTSRVCGGS